jgi:hypothetical protein
VTRARPALAAAVAAAAATSWACSGKIPETRYYQLAAPAAGPEAGRGELVLAIEPLSTDEAYQDERIVYRTSPYRLDYYNYHRWSAPPGVLVAGYLERALERSGRFRAVVREHERGPVLGEDAPAVLGGRILAIEEVDESRTRWLGRLVVELTLEDARSGAVLWAEQLAEAEPLAAQSPEGLARALSIALGRIAARALPSIIEHTERVASERR